MTDLLQDAAATFGAGALALLSLCCLRFLTVRFLGRHKRVERCVIDLTDHTDCPHCEVHTTTGLIVWRPGRIDIYTLPSLSLRPRYAIAMSEFNRALAAGEGPILRCRTSRGAIEWNLESHTLTDSAHRPDLSAARADRRGRPGPTRGGAST